MEKEENLKCDELSYEELYIYLQGISDNFEFLASEKNDKILENPIDDILSLKDGDVIENQILAQRFDMYKSEGYIEQYKARLVNFLYILANKDNLTGPNGKPAFFDTQYRIEGYFDVLQSMGILNDNNELLPEVKEFILNNISYSEDTRSRIYKIGDNIEIKIDFAVMNSDKEFRDHCDQEFGCVARIKTLPNQLCERSSDFHEQLMNASKSELLDLFKSSTRGIIDQASSHFHSIVDDIEELYNSNGQRNTFFSDMQTIIKRCNGLNHEKVE